MKSAGSASRKFWIIAAIVFGVAFIIARLGLITAFMARVAK